jgi:hypothetical protein
VLAGENLDRCASKFGSDLVETSGGDALFGTGDIEGADRGVV